MSRDAPVRRSIRSRESSPPVSVAKRARPILRTRSAEEERDRRRRGESHDDAMRETSTSAVMTRIVAGD